MIPIFINVRNRLTTTKRLAEQCSVLADAVPILIDNASDWPPLLDWYATCPFEVHRLRDNVGHHAPWLRVIPQADEFRRQFGSDYYVVTDCDLDLGGCPSDLLDVLAEPFQWQRKPIKSGLGLRIDDLPPWQQSVVSWENGYWTTPADADGRYFEAAVDTTFALYDCRTPHQSAIRVLPAIRSGSPYVAKHSPWYLDGNNLDAENAHYFASSSSSNSWKPRGDKSLSVEIATPCGFREISDLDKLFGRLSAIPSDINEHLPTLRRLASECQHVTEFGTRDGVSTVALLAAQPRALVAVDIQDQHAAVGHLLALAGKTELKLIQANDLEISTDETDLLFIDSFHSAKQLAAELEQHAGKSRRYIAMHDTVKFGQRGEDGSPGLRIAINEWLPRHPEWTIAEEHTNNSGLTVLSRNL